MVKLLKFFKDNILKIGISFLLIFIPLYPKFPSVHITHTWVYIRIEDFLIFLVVAIWLVQLILKKVKLPPKIWMVFGLYWLSGLLSLSYSLIFLAPHLANFFPSVAVLYYIRHIEYLILFFVAFSTIKSTKDLRDYLIIISIAVLGFSLYALGQRFYLDLWSAFPKFFEKYSYCFPSFQTGNEEFAKGIPLCLPKGARITSTFAGHYDLAAYLVLIIPVFVSLLFAVKNRLKKISVGLLTFVSIMVLIFTSSRISFIAYLLGITATLLLLKKKKFIIPFYALSIILLLVFSGSTAKRFMETFRIASVVTNNQGQVVGTANLPTDLKKKISDNILENVPSQNLPVGSGFLGLPQLNAPQKTNKAIVQSALSIEEAKRLKLENGGVEISTVSGSFLVRKVLVYDISFTTRFQAEWPNAWNAMLRNPLLGSGFATITLAADNNYLRILGETGLLGLSSFLAIFFVLGLILRQVLKTNIDKNSKGFLFGVGGGVLGLFFNALLIDVFEASKVAETLWILLGISAGVMFLYKKDFEYKKYIINILTSKPFIYFYLLFLSIVFYLKNVGNFFVSNDFIWLKWAATTNLRDLPKLFIDSQGFFYRPIDKLVMFFLYTLFSFSAQGYHIFMLSVHLLISFGVFMILQRIFKNKFLSFIGAFIFLFLPSAVQNVNWISSISVNLSVLFIIYSILFWFNFRTNQMPKLNYLLSIIFAVLALLSYEASFVVLPILLLFDLFILNVDIKSGKKLFAFLPLLLATVFYPLLRQIAGSENMFKDLTNNLGHLLPYAVSNLLGYLSLYLFGEKVLPFYSILRNILVEHALYTFVAVLAVAVLILGFIFSRRKTLLKSQTYKLFIFSVLFIFVGLIPFLGFGFIEPRFSYLSSFGFVFLLILVIRQVSLIFKAKEKIVLALILLILGSLYFYNTNMVANDWKEAGRITNRTLAYLRLYFDGSHPNSEFYFVNLPRKINDTPVFDNGLSDGIWFIYRDESIRTYQLISVEDGKKALSHSKDRGKTFVFGFDKYNNIYVIK